MLPGTTKKTDKKFPAFTLDEDEDESMDKVSYLFPLCCRCVIRRRYVFVHTNLQAAKKLFSKLDRGNDKYISYTEMIAGIERDEIKKVLKYYAALTKSLPQEIERVSLWHGDLWQEVVL